MSGRRSSARLKLFSTKPGEVRRSEPVERRSPETESPRILPGPERPQRPPARPLPGPERPENVPPSRPIPGPERPAGVPQPRPLPNPQSPARQPAAGVRQAAAQELPQTLPRSRRLPDEAVRYAASTEHYFDRNEARARQRVLKSSRFRRRYTLTASLLTALVIGLYSFIAFANGGALHSLRDAYIETALMTFSHSWLATAIFPSSVVDITRNAISAFEDEQTGLVSVWDTDHKKDDGIVISGSGEDEPEPDDEPVPGEEELAFWQKPESSFYRLFDELEPQSLIDYLTANPDSFDENGLIFIDRADVGADPTGIVTKNGDPVVAIDQRDGIMLARVSGGSFLSGNNYQGMLAFIKDASQIELAVSSRFGVRGETIGKIAGDNGAILGVNASGFADDGGTGNGGAVHGLVVVNGEKLHRAAGGSYFSIYFDSNDHLNISAYYDGLDIVNGVEFKPAIIVNGENKIANESFGIQPRTAVAQKADGTVMLLVVDGRQSTYSLGTTVTELEVIFERYNALQAACFDGGSSSVMYFNDRLVTSSSSPQEGGRYLPDALLVMPRAAEAEE